MVHRTGNLKATDIDLHVLVKGKGIEKKTMVHSHEIARGFKSDLEQMV